MNEHGTFSRETNGLWCQLNLPNCVGAPGSMGRYDWPQATISRKYREAAIVFEHVD